MGEHKMGTGTTETKSGDGNGEENGNGDGKEDGIGESRGEAKKRKKSHNSCGRDARGGGDLGRKRKNMDKKGLVQ